MRGYTLNYAPPEQIAGKRTDEKSDLYSLGATLYHLLTGDEPAPAVIREQGIHRLGFDPMKKELERLPAQLDEMIGKAMEMEPNARYSNATEMLQALKVENLAGKTEKTESRDRLKKPSESKASQEPAPQNGKSGTKIALIVGVLVLVAAIVTGIIYWSKIGIDQVTPPGV